MRLFHKRFLPIAMAVAVVTMVPPSLFARCGVERWSVKTGTDSDATQVRLTVGPTPTTISDLISLTPPHPIPKARRVSPTETLHACSQSARRCKSSVKVEKRRTG